VIAKKVRRASQTCKTQDFLADCRGRVSPSMLRSHHGRLRCGQGWWTGLTQRGMMQSAGWGSAMRSAADGERNQQRLSTAEEALSPPGSSFQASHQDALIHLRPSTAPLRKQKTVPQSLYQRNRGGPLGGQNCLGDRLETVALMFSPQDREMYWSGICTTRQDLPQPSPEAPNIGSCGSRFARLVGKFTHHGTKNRKGLRNEWHSCCGHVVSPRRSMSVPLPALGVQKERPHHAPACTIRPP